MAEGPLSTLTHAHLWPEAGKKENEQAMEIGMREKERERAERQAGERESRVRGKQRKQCKRTP